MQAGPTIVALPPPKNSKSAGDAIPPEESGKEEDRTVANLSRAWEYDDNQPYCAGCASEFTPLNRRHHCRHCGKIFCGKCSVWKALIPPSSIVLVPKGGKKVKRAPVEQISFNPDPDPDRMLTYTGADDQENIVLYGTGLEERFLLAREPLRVCQPCHQTLAPIQEELRQTNSNAMRYNFVDPTDGKRLFNSPLAFTLGHEVRKAAYTLNNLLPLPKRRVGTFIPENTQDFGYGDTTQQCRDECTALPVNLGNVDGVQIPAKLVEEAKGIAVMTVCKGGFGIVGGEFGTGLVVARLPNGAWSAPSAIGTAGISWGALVGAQVSDHVFLLMNESAVEMLFTDNGSLQLGADVGVAVGPVGRAFEGSVGAAPGHFAGIYTYSLSKGLYAGVSLDSKVIVTRHDVNEKFYGREVQGTELLSGAVPTPPAAQPLYDALTRCHVYATGRSVDLRALHMAQQQARVPQRYANLEYPSMLKENQSPPPTSAPPMAPPDQHSVTGTAISEVTYEDW